MPYHNLRPAKIINVFLTCLLTAHGVSWVFSSYFDHACEQTITIFAANLINFCKGIIDKR